MANEYPQLRFGAESEAKYQYINDEIFGGVLNARDLFLLAMSYGYSHGARVTEFKKGTKGPRTELTSADFALMSAMQIQITGKADSVLDTNARNEMAIQYAEGGIRLLFDLLSSARMADKRREFLTLIVQALPSES